MLDIVTQNAFGLGGWCCCQPRRHPRPFPSKPRGGSGGLPTRRAPRLNAPHGWSRGWRAWPAEVCARVADDQARQKLIDGFTQGGFARQYAAIRATRPWARRLAQLGMPTLIVSGAHDTCLPFEHAVALASAMPHAALACIGHQGHSLDSAVLQGVSHWLAPLSCGSGRRE